jgi:RNA polymerase sigma-70 factor, ECF subfamily
VSAQVDTALVAAAKTGNEGAFRELTDGYRRELHVHCYALQESLLRAWRHLGSFEGRSSFRAWLYRIATNVCLATPPGHLTPYPDALLDELPSTAAEPGARYDLRESVQLAMLAAVQTLPPRQRAVLLLRDVLGFSAKEVADFLDASPSSVHSVLQRARRTLEKGQPGERLDPPNQVQRTLVDRYVKAWESIDIGALVALLREDAVMTMPPDPQVFFGRRAIVDFFATVPAGGALDEIPLLGTRANRQPAVAAYLLDREAGVYRPYGIMVLTLDGDSIAEITGCADPTVFPLFGLPGELEAEPGH